MGAVFLCFFDVKKKKIVINCNLFNCNLFCNFMATKCLT